MQKRSKFFTERVALPSLSMFNQLHCNVFFPVCAHLKFKFQFLLFLRVCWSKIDFESIKLQANKFRLKPYDFILLSFFLFYYRKLILRLTNFHEIIEKMGKFFVKQLSSLTLINRREIHYKPNLSSAVANVYWLFFLWLKSFVNTNSNGKQIGDCKRVFGKIEGKLRGFILVT